MKLDKSQVLLSPEDEDLRECRFGFATGYPKIFSENYLGENIHKIIGERMGLITKRGNGFHIDHINRNKLDNRRENLRLINIPSSNYNREFSLKSKGVCLRKKKGGTKFEAQLSVDGKTIYLGTFDTFEQARKTFVEARNKRLTELGLADLLVKE